MKFEFTNDRQPDLRGIGYRPQVPVGHRPRAASNSNWRRLPQWYDTRAKLPVTVQGLGRGTRRTRSITSACRSNSGPSAETPGADSVIRVDVYEALRDGTPDAQMRTTR